MSITSALNAVTDRIGGIYTKFNSAIIVSGGSGTRAGTQKPKQLMELCGLPVIVRTVNVFEKCKFINEIIVVTREEDIALINGYINKYGWKKVVNVVKGGKERRDSVLNGFKAISDKSEFVYIHDGARCLITEKMIAKVGHAACSKGSAIAACKASDTVKIKEGGYLSTPDRSKIYYAQTPQVFMTELYRAAAYSANTNNICATDDASLVEALGFKVEAVDVGSTNIKITHPEDFAVAEALLKFRETEKKK